jgi:ferredoxin
MPNVSLRRKEKVVIGREGIDQLLEILKKSGYRTIAPAVESGAIVLKDVDTAADLPIGWRDQQSAGKYALEKDGRDFLFGYVLGPHSWKRYLYPPKELIWQGQKTGQGVELDRARIESLPQAFLGVRPCELHAISILDRVFDTRDYVDPSYESRRKGAFIVAVNCTRPGGTCFCASMNTGPGVNGAFDIALTELQEKDGYTYLSEAGSQRGAKVLTKVKHRRALENEIDLAKRLIEQASDEMGRSLPTASLKWTLSESYEDPRWDEVAKRCLACGNCTMVCPTCFCHTLEDSTSLNKESTERTRRWDSCFTRDFSYMHGGSVRLSSKSRFRHWLLHKLCTWEEQFGTAGCVGCGRCITWCPVGIDIREAAKTIVQAKHMPVDKQ